MLLLPFQIFVSLVLGLLAFFLFALATFFLLRGYHRLPGKRVTAWRYAPDGAPIGTATTRGNRTPISALAMLVAGAILLLWTFTGRFIILSAFPESGDDPQALRSDAAQTIERPEGVRLHVESFGSANAPTLVFTHGWSMDSDEWYYVKRQLAGRFHVVVWDIRGLGRSSRPDNGDFSLDTMAGDLAAVVDAAGPRVVLVGHSIGGMINLTFCRRYPERLGKQVAGIIELNTTYTDPVKTTDKAETHTALQKPVYEPLLHVFIPLSPLIRFINWLSYQSGLAHLQAESSFAGTETRGQLDFVAKYNYKSSTAVVSRGMLGMLHWDATDELPRISVPTLIVTGDQDTTTLPQAGEQMQKSIPNSELRMIQPAAHLGVLERNKEYNEEIARFAQRCFSGSAAR